MKRVRLSPVRRFVLWWMEPGSRYVSTSLVVDFAASRRYLNTLREGEGARVTVQHLVCAVVGRLYQEFPVANRRIVGRRVYQADTVGIACPVNLVGHAGEDGVGETSMMLLESVETLSLREVATASRATVRQERSGTLSNPFARRTLKLLKRLPGPLFRSGLRGIASVTEAPGMARLGWKLAPMTVAVTNVGAAYAPIEGALLRGGAYELPHRILHLGSLWGIGAVQDEVIAVAGAPVVRPMLPVMLVFDHRLFDGVIASQILRRFTEMLQDPALLFGADGNGLYNKR